MEEEGGAMFQAVWDSLGDSSTLDLMLEHPIQAYCCRVFDQGQDQSQGTRRPEIACLVRPELVRHTAMLVVTTDGQVLSRSRRGAQFTKLGCGGGKRSKSLVHCHYACREGLDDEFGISFHNPAVLDISPP